MLEFCLRLSQTKRNPRVDLEEYTRSIQGIQKIGSNLGAEKNNLMLKSCLVNLRDVPKRIAHYHIMTLGILPFNI